MKETKGDENSYCCKYNFSFCICAYRPYYKALERRYKLDTLFLYIDFIIIFTLFIAKFLE